jgi:universal stress protein A
MKKDQMLIYPTDFSDCSLAALPWVHTMATALGADVACLYVVEEPTVYGSVVAGPVAMPSAHDLAQRAEAHLGEFVASHGKAFPRPPTTTVLIGRPDEEIVRFARDNKAALIVMSTHGYRGAKHLLLGSTTERVIRNAQCPVLSIRAT